MWRFLIPLLLHSIDALPAARDVTSTCPHDALYTSLVSSGISFCSSVIGNGHCAGGGYTTPSAYLTYNQTQISSYVSCVVVQTHCRSQKLIVASVDAFWPTPVSRL
ncbi:hypothetical protein AUP68_00906 [Ilyonectria robusta]